MSRPRGGTVSRDLRNCGGGTRQCGTPLGDDVAGLFEAKRKPPQPCFIGPLGFDPRPGAPDVGFNPVKGFHSSDLCSIRPFISPENSIPEEMDHREIAVRMPVMNEVQFLFASEPCKPLKPRSLYVVFVVEKNVRVERRRACDYLNHEEINGQYEVCARSYQKHRNEEEGRIIAFVTEVRL